MGALSVIGVSADAEQIYRWLAVRASAARGELSTQLGIEPERLEAALAELRERAMLREEAGAICAAAPDIVLAGLIRESSAELDRARDEMVALATAYRRVARDPDTHCGLEVVAGQPAVREVVHDLVKGTRKEIRVASRAPLLINDTAHDLSVRAALARGVELRNIVDASAIEAGHGAAPVTRSAESHGSWRVIPSSPFSFVICDLDIALVAVAGENASHAAVIVRPSAMLEGLLELFELLWGLSVPPANGDSEGDSLNRSPGVTNEQATMLSLMAAGLKDEAIAYRLGLSARTCRRRVSGLRGRLGAQTRFQAGYQAAKRGWL